MLSSCGTKSWLFSLSVCFFAVVAAQAQENVTASEAAVAIVDGESLTDEDLGIQAQLTRLEHEAYLLRLRALEDWTSRRALAKAAADSGLTVPEFLQQVADRKVLSDLPEGGAQPPAGAAVPADKAEARQELLRRLRGPVPSEILVTPRRLSADIEGAPRKGGHKARVTIVEYSDFHCPYCKKAQPVLQEILAEYGETVTLVFKDLPLERIHPGARRSAEAAHCAGEQGRFWEFHDRLFAAPAVLPDLHLAIAEALDLDSEKFQDCLDSGKYRERARQSEAEARGLGMNTTPSFLINGILVVGAQSIETFRRVLDAELAGQPHPLRPKGEGD